MINKFIKNVNTQIATLNNYNKNIDTIIYYHKTRHDNYYNNNTYKRAIKQHIDNTIHKYTTNTSIDELAISNIINYIEKLTNYYNITLEDLYKIFNILGYKSNYKDEEITDSILECLLLINEDNHYEINYNLLYHELFETYLEYFDYANINNCNVSIKENVLTFISENLDYYYSTNINKDLIRNNLLQLLNRIHYYQVNIIQIFGIGYFNHILDYINQLFDFDYELNDKGLFKYIFDEEYDLFPVLIDEYTFNEYEYNYCIENNLDYDDYPSSQMIQDYIKKFNLNKYN